MIAIMLAKRNPRSIILPLFTANRNGHPFLSRFFSANPDPQTPHFSVADYLFTSFGLSREKAARISKPIAHLKSPEKPDAVRRFLSAEGFTETDVKSIVTSFPTLLCSPEGSLRTNLIALRDMGLSTSALTQIIISQPKTLQLRSAAPPRIKFWMDFFGGDEAALLKAFKNNRKITSLDITRTIVPKLSFLKSQGITTQDVRRIVLSARGFITRGTHSMEDTLNRTKELGFQLNSKMFPHGLQAISCCSRELLQEKMALLKSYGWSEDECGSIIRTFPRFASLSEDNLRTTLNFLTREARCKPSYIASNPTLLAFSLEKRLRPRNNVLLHLESKGLLGKKMTFYSVMKISENAFVERFILPHKDKFSTLHEAYLAALA